MKSAFWIVTADYVKEAQTSSVSLKEVMPDVERWLFSPDLPENPGKFTHFRRLPERQSEQWFVDCTRYVIEALEQLSDLCLYLDSDTYFIYEVNELFAMLDRFDFVAAHAPGRRTAPTVHPIPECFPELNIGVIAMQNNPQIRKLWQSVYAAQLEYPHVYGRSDQAPLREVLWQDRDLRWAVIPPEYNCRFQFGTFVRDPVRVLHGRGDYRQVAQSINSKKGKRTWQPECS